MIAGNDFMTKSTRKSSDTPAEITRRLLKIITGPGVAKRIAADAKKPVISSRNDGVFFDPRWQDDIPAPPKPKKSP